MSHKSRAALREETSCFSGFRLIRLSLSLILITACVFFFAATPRRNMKESEKITEKKPTCWAEENQKIALCGPLRPRRVQAWRLWKLCTVPAAAVEKKTLRRKASAAAFPASDSTPSGDDVQGTRDCISAILSATALTFSLLLPVKIPK